MSERRHTGAELRADGTRLEGVAVKYGDVARIPFPPGRERFDRGAFGNLESADLLLNVQHTRGRHLARTRGGGLELSDSPQRLVYTADLPNTTEARDTLELVKSGILRGTSIEFEARQEAREGGIRAIRAAYLTGLAVVDVPAYPASTVDARGAALVAVLEDSLEGRDREALIERMAGEAGITPSTVTQILRQEINAPPLERLEGFARALGVRLEALIDAVVTDGGDVSAYGRSLLVNIRQTGAGLAGAFRYNTETVTSDRGRDRKQVVAPGAFDFAIDAPDREINLIMGRSYDRPLASKRAGTLEISNSERELVFTVERLPDTTYAQDLRAGLASGAAVYGVQPLFQIPPPDVVPNAVETVPEVPGGDVMVERVNAAVLTALAVVARAPRGNPGTVEARARRRRLWL